MAAQIDIVCQHERKYSDSDGNTLNIIPPRFGSIAFDDNYSKNEVKFTTFALGQMFTPTIQTHAVNDMFVNYQWTCTSI